MAAQVGQNAAGTFGTAELPEQVRGLPSIGGPPGRPGGEPGLEVAGLDVAKLAYGPTTR